jgi:hypothetical protein
MKWGSQWDAVGPGIESPRSGRKTFFDRFMVRSGDENPRFEAQLPSLQPKKSTPDDRDLRAWSVEVRYMQPGCFFQGGYLIMLVTVQMVMGGKVRKVSLTVSPEYITLCDGRSKVS